MEAAKARMERKERAARVAAEQERQRQANEEAKRLSNLSTRFMKFIWKDALVVVLDDFHSDHGNLVSGVVRRYFKGQVNDIDTRSSEAFNGLLDFAGTHSDSIIVVNMSFRSDFGFNYADSNQDDVFRKLAGLGFVFIAAAGNEGEDHCSCPACYDNVIAVGSVLAGSNIVDPSSNHGSCIDIFADGQALKGFAQSISSASDMLWGTSFASAYVSAAIGNLLQNDPWLGLEIPHLVSTLEHRQAWGGSRYYDSLYSEFSLFYASSPVLELRALDAETQSAVSIFTLLRLREKEPWRFD